MVVGRRGRHGCGCGRRVANGSGRRGSGLVRRGGAAWRLGTNSALEVGVPDAFVRQRIDGHFASNLIEVAEAVMGVSAAVLTFRVFDQVEPKVEPRPSRSARYVAFGKPTFTHPDVPGRSADVPARAPRNQSRSPRRSATSVTWRQPPARMPPRLGMGPVVGLGVQPAGRPRRVGLGKTYLPRGSAMRSGQVPGLRLIQATAEVSTNSFLDAHARARWPRPGRATGPRRAILDDVALPGRRACATEDWIPHTFNALTRRCADRPGG